MTTILDCNLLIQCRSVRRNWIAKLTYLILMKQQMTRSSLFLILFVSTLSAGGQIVQFSFNGSAGNEASLSPDAQPVNGSVSDITRGSGLNPSSSAGEFSSNNWSKGGIDPTDYYSISASADSGFELTLTSLVFDERRSGSGIREISIRSSIDGFNLDLAIFTVPDNTSVRTQTIDLGSDFANLSSLTSVEFRIYGYSAESTSGTWWLDNIQLWGAIASPDTEPPMLDTVMVLSPITLGLQFNEGVDDISAEKISSYILNNSTNPLTAVRQSTLSEVILTFENQFQDGLINTLAVSDISDLAGNTMSTVSLDFTYNKVSLAIFKDIVPARIIKPSIATVSILIVGSLAWARLTPRIPPVAARGTLNIIINGKVQDSKREHMSR